MDKLFEFCIEFAITALTIKPEIISVVVEKAQETLSKQPDLIAPVIFIGECVKLDKSIRQKFPNMSQTIKALLDNLSVPFHKKLSKYLRGLIVFFDKPESVVQELLETVPKFKDEKKVHVYAFYVSGLLRGMGIRKLLEMNILDKLQDTLLNSKKRDLKDIDVSRRYFIVFLIEGLWTVFGKSLEPYLQKLIDILLSFLGDNQEEIRHYSKFMLDKLMHEISEFGIKNIIPVLLKGTQDKNWRTKLNSIHALGAISNCGTKQLSTSLPVIVPQLTSTINDTNIEIKDAAVNSLSLILSTIKNPEISDNRDVLIRSLSDPFNQNVRSLDLLLHIEFKHYIDGPALALIMPVIIYGLKNSKDETSKEKSAKVVANISTLISKDEDILPHIDTLIEGLMFPLKEMEPEIRGVAAKAFKNLSTKFKGLSKMMLNRLKSILESETANSIEKAGAAQAFSEVVATLDPQLGEELLNNCLMLTQDSRDYIRESFLSVFVYLPMVMSDSFEKYVFRVIQVIVESISHEKERIRNLAIKSMKILIRNFLRIDSKVLIEPLFEGAISENSTKRNSSLILLGDVVDILNEQYNDKEVLFQTFPRLFSIFYIMKNDNVAEVRITATNIYKTFVDNPIKCLKIIFGDLVESFISLYLKNTIHCTNIANHGLTEFSYKYGEMFVTKIVATASFNRNHSDDKYKKGLCIFFKYFVLFFNNNYLTADRKKAIYDLLYSLFNEDNESVWSEAIKSIRIFIEKTIDISVIDDILSTSLKGFETWDQSVELYDKMIAFFCELLQSRNMKVIHNVNKYVIKQPVQEWQLEILMKNSKVFGNLLYHSEDFTDGIDMFIEDLQVI